MDTKQNKIRYIVSDIDGVLTSGHFFMDKNRQEYKQIFYRDLDAIRLGRTAGLDYIFVTAENTEMSHAIGLRFGVEIREGIRDKKKELRQICRDKQIGMDQVCYIGDSDNDAQALQTAGFGVAPKDASLDACQAANFITQAQGGNGVLIETVKHIIHTING